MHLHAYVLTIAEDKEDAISKVNGFIEDEACANKGYPFDYGCTVEDDVKILDKEFIDYLRKNREDDYKKQMSEIEKNIFKHTNNNDLGMLGYYFVRKGHLICQDLCVDMPFFNIENWDYSLPNDFQKEERLPDGSNWYAVMCDLHF